MKKLKKCFLLSLVLTIVFISCREDRTNSSEIIPKISKNAPTAAGNYEEYQLVKAIPSSIAFSGDPAVLFDNNINTGYIAVKPQKIHLSYVNQAKIKSIGVYGNTSNTINIYTETDGAILDFIHRVDNSSLTGSWDTVDLEKTVIANNLVIEIIPDSKAREVKKMEIWREDTGILSDRYQCHSGYSNSDIVPVASNRPAHIHEYTGIPDELMSGNISSFKVQVPLNSVIYKQALFVYEGNKIFRPVSIERRINGLSWCGGFNIPDVTVNPDLWTTQEGDKNF